MAVARQHYGIVVSHFNEFITKRLLTGCLDELKINGIKESQIRTIWVPGAFEIPITALRLAKKTSVAVVISLGAVIRGETIHFDLVARQATQGIAQASLMTGKPVIFGIITTDTVNQAYARSKLKGDNKGRDAARAAVEMVGILKKI